MLGMIVPSTYVRYREKKGSLSLSLFIYIYSNILKIAELDCCQIIILSIYVQYNLTAI
jgi:hypothetical protein